MTFSKIKLQIVKEKNYNYNSRIIKGTIDVVKCINDIEELDKAPEESTIIICLNAKNQIMAYSVVAKGGIDFCNLDFKNILKIVLLTNCNKFVLVHNHPSGEVKASKYDLDVTKRLREVAKLVDLQLLDHIIIGNNGFASCMNL